MDQVLCPISRIKISYCIKCLYVYQILPFQVILRMTENRVRKVSETASICISSVVSGVSDVASSVTHGVGDVVHNVTLGKI